MTLLATTPIVEVVRTYLDVFNRSNWDVYKRTLTPDSVHIEPGMELDGPDAMVEGLSVFKTAFPDLCGDVIRLIGGDAEVAAEIVWRGTHTGPLVTPTGTIQPRVSRSRSMPRRSSPSTGTLSITAATTRT